MSEKTDLQKAQDRIKELEKELVDIKQGYQIVMLRLVNYIQAVDSSTTLVKDNLRGIVSNIK
jgi:hypothetical protein